MPPNIVVTELHDVSERERALHTLGWSCPCKPRHGAEIVHCERDKTRNLEIVCVYVETTWHHRPYQFKSFDGTDTPITALNSDTKLPKGQRDMVAAMETRHRTLELPSWAWPRD